MSINPGFTLSSSSGTSAVYIDSTAGTLAVNVGKTDGTVTIRTDPGYELGSIKGINSSIGVHVLSTGGTINVALKPGTMAVSLDPGYTLGKVEVSSMPTTSGVHLTSTGGTIGVRVGQVDGTVAVYFSPANPAVSATFSGSISAVPESGQGEPLYDESKNAMVFMQKAGETFAVYFDPATPSVAATFSGSIAAVPQSGSGDPLYDESKNAVVVMQKSGETFAVYFDPASPAVSASFSGSIAAVPTTGSGDPIYEETGNWTRVLIAGSQAAASLEVTKIAQALPAGTNAIGKLAANSGVDIGDVDVTSIAAGTNDLGNIIRVKNVVDGTLTTVTTVGAVTNITNSIAVHLLSTGGTIHVRLADNSAGVHTDDTAFTPATDVGHPAMGLFDDTSTDSVDEGDAGIFRMTGNRIQMVHTDGTASVFTASGSASGVSVSGNTIISPSSAYSFKIYAFSVQTTAQVSLTCKFTNGAGTGPTEYFRPLITASGVTGAQGANLSTAGPGNPLFVTATNTTLSLVLDSASLVHYSVSYTKESA